jgi:hypothetical protein
MTNFRYNSSQIPEGGGRFEDIVSSASQGLDDTLSIPPQCDDCLALKMVYQSFLEASVAAASINTYEAMLFVHQEALEETVKTVSEQTAEHFAEHSDSNEFRMSPVIGHSIEGHAVFLRLGEIDINRGDDESVVRRKLLEAIDEYSQGAEQSSGDAGQVVERAKDCPGIKSIRAFLSDRKIVARLCPNPELAEMQGGLTLAQVNIEMNQ